jgi:hypothetical protein
MEAIKYKNNKYVQRGSTWYIVGEGTPPVTVGSLVKLKYPDIIKKLERKLKKLMAD